MKFLFSVTNPFSSPKKETNSISSDETNSESRNNERLRHQINASDLPGLITDEQSDVETLEEVQTEDPTISAKLIIDRKFTSALKRLKEYPEEARIWNCIRKRPSFRSSKKNHRRDSWPRPSPLTYEFADENADFSMRQLPIHIACACLVLVTPSTLHMKEDLEHLIKHLAVKYPVGCGQRDGEGRIPLHEAIRFEAEVETISVLLMAFPEATRERDRYGLLPKDILRHHKGDYFDKVNDLLRRGVNFWEQARNEAMLRMKLNLKVSSKQSASSTVALQGSLRSITKGDQQSLLGELSDEEDEASQSPSTESAQVTEVDRLKHRCFHLEQTLEEMYRRNIELAGVSSELEKQREESIAFKQMDGELSSVLQDLRDENSDLRKRQQRLEIILRDNGLDPSDIESVDEPEGISMMGMDPERPTVLTDYMERKIRNLQGETDALVFENEALQHQVHDLESQMKRHELKDLAEKIPMPALESKKRSRSENERILIEKLLAMHNELDALREYHRENGVMNNSSFQRKSHDRSMNLETQLELMSNSTSGLSIKSEKTESHHSVTSATSWGILSLTQAPRKQSVRKQSRSRLPSLPTVAQGQNSFVSYHGSFNNSMELENFARGVSAETDDLDELYKSAANFFKKENESPWSAFFDGNKSAVDFGAIPSYGVKRKKERRYSDGGAAPGARQSFSLRRNIPEEEPNPLVTTSRLLAAEEEFTAIIHDVQDKMGKFLPEELVNALREVALKLAVDGSTEDRSIRTVSQAFIDYTLIDGAEKLYGQTIPLHFVASLRAASMAHIEMAEKNQKEDSAIEHMKKRLEEELLDTLVETAERQLRISLPYDLIQALKTAAASFESLLDEDDDENNANPSGKIYIDFRKMDAVFKKAQKIYGSKFSKEVLVALRRACFVLQSRLEGTDDPQNVANEFHYPLPGQSLATDRDSTKPKQKKKEVRGKNKKVRKKKTTGSMHNSSPDLFATALSSSWNEESKGSSSMRGIKLGSSHGKGSFLQYETSLKDDRIKGNLEENSNEKMQSVPKKELELSGGSSAKRGFEEKAKRNGNKPNKLASYMNSLADFGDSSMEFSQVAPSCEATTDGESDYENENDDNQSTALSRAGSEVSMDIQAVFNKEPSALESQLKMLQKPVPTNTYQSQNRKPPKTQGEKTSEAIAASSISRRRLPPRRTGSGELDFIAQTLARSSHSHVRRKGIQRSQSDDLSSMATSLSSRGAARSAQAIDLAASVRATDDLDTIFKLSAQSDTVDQARSRSTGDLSMESLMASTSHLPEMSGENAFATIITDTEETYGIKIPQDIVNAIKRACLGVFPNVPLLSILKALYDDNTIKEAERYCKHPIPADIISAIRSASLPPGLSIEKLLNPEGTSNSSQIKTDESRASPVSFASESQMSKGMLSEPSLDTYVSMNSASDGIVHPTRKVSLHSVSSDHSMDNSWTGLSMSASPALVGRKKPDPSQPSQDPEYVRQSHSAETPKDFMNSLADFGDDLSDLFKQAADVLDKFGSKESRAKEVPLHSSTVAPTDPVVSGKKGSKSVVPRPRGADSCIQVSPQELELDLLLDTVAKDSGVYIPYEIDVALRKASRSMDESLDFISSVRIHSQSILFGTHLSIERLKTLFKMASIYLGYVPPEGIHSQLFRSAQTLIENPPTERRNLSANYALRKDSMYTKDILHRRKKLRPTAKSKKRNESHSLNSSASSGSAGSGPSSKSSVEKIESRKSQEKGMDLKSFLSPSRQKKQGAGKALVISHDGKSPELSPMTMCSSMNAENEKANGKVDLMNASKLRLQALSSIIPADLDDEQEEEDRRTSSTPGLESIPYEHVEPSKPYEPVTEEKKMLENISDDVVDEMNLSKSGEVLDDIIESDSENEEDYLGASAELSAIIAEAQTEFGMSISEDLLNALKETQIDPDLNDDSFSLTSDTSSLMITNGRLVASGESNLSSKIQDRLLSPVQKSQKKQARESSSMADRLELENGLAVFVEAAAKECNREIPSAYVTALRKAALGFQPDKQETPLSHAFYGAPLIATLERAEEDLDDPIDSAILGAFWRASYVVQHRDAQRHGSTIATSNNVTTAPSRHLDRHGSGYFSATSVGESTAFTMSSSLAGEAILGEVKNVHGEVPKELLQKFKKYLNRKNAQDDDSLQLDYSVTSFASSAMSPKSIKDDSLQFDYSATSFASNRSPAQNQDAGGLLLGKSAHSELSASNHSDIDSFASEFDRDHGRPVFVHPPTRNTSIGSDDATLDTNAKSMSKSSRGISSLSAESMNNSHSSNSSSDLTVESDYQTDGLQAMAREAKSSEKFTNSHLPPEVPHNPASLSASSHGDTFIKNIGPALLTKVRRIYSKKIPLEIAYVLTRSVALSQATNTDAEIDIIKREVQQMTGTGLPADLILALREASVSIRNPTTTARSKRARLIKQSSASGSFRSTSRSSSMPSIQENSRGNGRNLIDPDEDLDETLEDSDGQFDNNSSTTGSASMISKEIYNSKHSLASTLNDDMPDDEKSFASASSDPSITLNASLFNGRSDPTSPGGGFNNSTATAIASNTTEPTTPLASNTSASQRKKKKWAPILHVIGGLTDEDGEGDDAIHTVEPGDIPLRASSILTVQSGNSSPSSKQPREIPLPQSTMAIRQSSSSSTDTHDNRSNSVKSMSKRSSDSSSSAAQQAKRELFESMRPPLEGVETDDLAAIFQEAARRHSKK